MCGSGSNYEITKNFKLPFMKYMIQKQYRHDSHISKYILDREELK